MIWYLSTFAWMEQAGTIEEIVPYLNSNLSKKEQVAHMFDHIARRYDFMNHFISLGIDRAWRKKAARRLLDSRPKMLLDVATGTGDFAITLFHMLRPDKIIGIDISSQMLEIGQKKVRHIGLEGTINLQSGDSETIKFPDNTFDAVTVAFGLRNFEDLEMGLKEMIRVLKPNGKLVALECSSPRHFPAKQLYDFYFRFIVPQIGRWVADSRNAYDYLPRSVRAFPQGENMLRILEKTGFHSAICKTLTFGVCSMYTASK